MREFLAGAGDFGRRLGHEVIPLTDERVAELAAMRGRTGPRVPEQRTVSR